MLSSSENEKPLLWRQGSVVSKEEFQSLGIDVEQEADFAIVISHDCDILHKVLSDEPSIEFIFAKVVAEKNGSYCGKNPRILHLDFDFQDNIRTLELRATEKFLVRKELATLFEPKMKISNESLEPLKSWLAIRYKRHSLPNSLHDRFRKILEYLHEKGKKNSGYTVAYFMRHDPIGELEESQDYEVWIKILYSSSISDVDVKKIEGFAKTLSEKFQNLVVAENGGIELRECTTISESLFTVEQQRQYKRLYFDYLSYRQDPQVPVIEICN
jgi:hypothetical protein